MEEWKTMSIGEWIITLIVLSIPIVGFIMLLVWGFGNDDKLCRKNYCLASLILAAIGLVIALFLFGIFGTSLAYLL